MKKLKPFDLEHAIKTGVAQDENGNVWCLSMVDIKNRLLNWEKYKDRTLTTRTDNDGKFIDDESPIHRYLYSAEIIKSTQTFYAAKSSHQAEYSIIYGENDYPAYNIRYELNLNLEDGEIVSVDFRKVE